MSSTVTRHSAVIRWTVLATIAIGLVATLWLTPGRSASADELGQPPAAPAESAEGHEGVESDPESNLPFLFAVYLITWGGFFAFVLVMSRRQREMQRELEALKAAIAEREAGEMPSEPTG